MSGIDDLPVIASYLVRVTVRGNEGATAPTIDEIERIIEDGVVLTVDGGTAAAVRASAERTDV